MNWRFNEESINILTSQSEDMINHPYLTQAVIINHDESNRIIIAFRGTEPMDLVQRMSDASTELIDINNVFNNINNNVNKIRVHARFYYALGLNQFNPSQPINFNNVTSESPMFIQLLYFLQKFYRNKKEYKISVTWSWSWRCIGLII
jgi:hypothetical protein